jgi:hypothetical protein
MARFHRRPEVVEPVEVLGGWIQRERVGLRAQIWCVEELDEVEI